jgi:hypothetical protein
MSQRVLSQGTQPRQAVAEPKPEEASPPPEAAARQEPKKERKPRLDGAGLLRRNFALDVFKTQTIKTPSASRLTAGSSGWLGARRLRDHSSSVVAQVMSGGGHAGRVFAIRLNWCGTWWVCPVHADYLKEHHLDPPVASEVLTIADEDRADALMEAFPPVCYACLSEWLHASPELAPIARQFDQDGGTG